MDLAFYVFTAVAIGFLLFFSFVVCYYRKEQLLFKRKGWKKALAKEKSISVKPYQNDGRPEVDLTCSYKFEAEGVEHTGQKPFFGHLLVRLDHNEMTQLTATEDFNKCIYFLEDDPRESVAFLYIPKKLEDYMMYSTLTVALILLFLVAWFWYHFSPIFNS